MAGVWTNKAKAVYHQRLSHPASHLLLDLGCQKPHSTQVNIYFLCNKKRHLSKIEMKCFELAINNDKTIIHALPAKGRYWRKTNDNVHFADTKFERNQS